MGRLMGSRARLYLSVPFGLAFASSAFAQTEEQAERGAAAYAQNCAVCHGADMTGGPFGPALTGEQFQARWGGAPLSDLADYVSRSMPPAAPGSLSDADYASIMAHQMAQNGAELEGDELTLDSQQLASLTVPGQATISGDPAQRAFASVSSRGRIPEWPAPADPLADFQPVTEEMLANPPPADWLSWRRSHRGQGFSPLTQVTRENVGDLRLAWSLALPAGPNTMEPLVHDGVLYMFGYGDEVYALDAATGRQLWRYQRHLPEGQALAVKKTMALYGDRLFVATSDLHMLALDARTGRPVWDRLITDRTGFRITGGPLAADGVVMQGVVGQGPGGALISGFDAETGEQLWTFNTVAQPGEPGGDTWNGLAAEERTGGSIWTSGTYDSETGLAFFGPAPTYDTGPMRNRVEGENNDGLYTDSTIALDPRTGELAWHYQHMKNDQWDMDWAFERVIADMEIDGRASRVVMTSGKEGLFDVLDAASGDYVTTVDMGLQNFVTAIDPETGEKTIDPDLIPGGREDVITLCPYGGGGRNWIPTAFNPETSILYVVAQDVCTDIVPVEGGGFLSTGVNMEIAPRPDSDGRYGLVQAMNMQTGEIVWRARQRAPQTTGVLATAGGVVFAGALDRNFTAYDDSTGEILWQAGVNDTPNAAPITYSVDGKQYVALTVGHGSPVTNAFTGLAPEITVPPVRSSSVFVFALPE